MKCPKCGYNSFEFLDACKKCNNDLSAFKESHGIRAIIPNAVASPVLSAETPPSDNPDMQNNLEDTFIPAEEDTFSWNATPGDDQPPSADGETAGLELDLIPPSPDTSGEEVNFIEPTAVISAADLDDGQEGLIDFSFETTAIESTSPAVAEADKGADDLADLLESSRPESAVLTAQSSAAAEGVADFESTFSFDEPVESADNNSSSDNEFEPLLTDETPLGSDLADPPAGTEAPTGTFDDLFADKDSDKDKTPV